MRFGSRWARLGFGTPPWLAFFTGIWVDDGAMVILSVYLGDRFAGICSPVLDRRTGYGYRWRVERERSGSHVWTPLRLRRVAQA